MNDRLNDQQRETLLPKLLEEGWEHDPGRDAIRREFKFKSFRVAWSWMTLVAIEAEKMNHHPEWSNTYNKVWVTLVTHSANGLTELDVALAEKMQKHLVAGFG